MRSPARHLLLIALAVAGCHQRRSDATVDAGADAATTVEVPPRPFVPLDTGCEHLFAARYERPCGGPALPDDVLARAHDRFIAACHEMAALPGSGADGAWNDDCAAAIEAQGCQSYPPTLVDPPECGWVQGSLPDGAPCNVGAQCTSGGCVLPPWTQSPQGQVDHPPGCGTCAPALPVGARCDAWDAVCAPGSACDSTSRTCTAIRVGELGDGCGSLWARCRRGLYCSRATGKCAPLDRAVGDACEGGGLGPAGCAPNLVCIRSRCAEPAQVGESCEGDVFCARGLACVNGKCTTFTWRAPGESCDGFGGSQRCEVGSCDSGGPGLGPGTQACPTVVADGDLCNPNDRSTSCDLVAGCYGPTVDSYHGTCRAPAAYVCR